MESLPDKLAAAPSRLTLDQATIVTEEIFRQIICHLDQAVWISDAESNQIRYLSPVHEKIWGRSLEELYGNDAFWTETIHPDDRERVLKAALEGQSTGTYDEQYRILRPDGEVRWIRDRAFPIWNAQGKVHCIAGIAEDMTERKMVDEQFGIRMRERTEEFAWANLALESEISERRRAELQLRESDHRLQKALQELHAAQQQVIQQEKVPALERVAGVVAHDLNKGLIPIIGYAEYLIESSELLDDRAIALRYLRLMRTAAKDATAVVAWLREFARQRDSAEIYGPVDLLEALTDAISMTRLKWHDEPLGEGRHLTVKQDFQPVPLIEGNGGEIREVVTNLIFNAAEALPEGGTIVVRAYSDEQHSVFEVQDDGIGMTEEVRARCMEPFVTTKGESGAGLGLAVAYGIVQRHHGKIEVESRLREGSLVRVHLPFYRGGSVAQAAERSSMIGRSKILLAADEQVVRDVVSLFLRQEEHEVEVTATAIDALRMAREQKFDLVIVDRAVPGMTEGNFLTVLRSVGSDVPILFLTGSPERMTTAESIPEGVTKVVNKPVTMEDLRSAISALFQDSKLM
jgi:PAS domain S-box-containing protein